jgi:hypothetical protein
MALNSATENLWDVTPCGLLVTNVSETHTVSIFKVELI